MKLVELALCALVLSMVRFDPSIQQKQVYIWEVVWCLINVVCLQIRTC